MGPDTRKVEHERLLPRDIPPEYYGFAHYVSKERMITYWHQVDEVLRRRPTRILEVGIGNGIVSSILKCYGIESTTADINQTLRPGVVVPVSKLDSRFAEGEFPFVLCARVLQHLPFSEFGWALSQLRHVTSAYALLTLPVETFRFYTRFRVTGGDPTTVSVPFPLTLKRLLRRIVRGEQPSETQNFWKIGQRQDTSLKNVRRVLEDYFCIEDEYRVPEDMSHAFFILRKR